MPTARSTPNIALIKYWGNRNNDLRLPANANLAMTLDTPYVDITVTPADAFSVTSNNKKLHKKDIGRFQKTFDRIKQYLSSFHLPLSIESISIEIDSHIPSGIGLASSAAVFSALAKAISGLSARELTDEQISVMARLGSGSAARSIFGGFVALTNNQRPTANNQDALDGYIAQQIAPASHWNLHDIIIAPSTEEKKIGSTEGHAGAWTSPHYAQRVEEVNSRRQQECIDAILEKDFEKLQKVAEEDCMDMHRCMQTQHPPLQYLNDVTYRIIDEITALREAEHLPVLYTMDAGPTVHLFCEKEAVEQINQYAQEQKECIVFEASAGQGASITK